ncbi:E3 ubiquitin-protein ligase RFWD3-like isoform X2 [Bacillus rossius redtenbacheri]|uniref:E3 ubiquitin-protein ligase RFWD3-like isoform X2 n=1 Tax=Bacillus rossius redtenbacheri TaxID=93214 RepID=UPI002FDE8E2C
MNAQPCVGRCRDGATSTTMSDQSPSAEPPGEVEDDENEAPGDSDVGKTAGQPEEPEEDDQCFKGQKRKHMPDETDDDGTICPVCLTEWTNAGEHRLVSLKCGHLFGLSCIERWLTTGCGAQQRRCPQCNKKASRADVRSLFARRVIVLDTAEQERLRAALEAEQREKNQLKVELAHVQLNNKFLQQKLAETRQRADDGCTPVSTPCGTPGPLQLVARSTIAITRDGGCRVLAFSPALNLLVVSQPSTNPVFAGFGVRKVDTLDFRPTQFAHLHQQQIRDLAFHGDKVGLLLSVGTDKRARLFDVRSNATVETFNTDSPLWSCCWDADNPFVFLVGGQNGQLLRFDTRRSGGAGEAMDPEVQDRSPLVSLASVSSGSVLACHLSSVQLLRRREGRVVAEPVPLHGPFFSLRYDPATQHSLVSSRPSDRFPQTRHALCQVAPVSVVREFSGGTSQKLLSRPIIMSVGANVMVAAHEESSGCLAVWDVSSGSKVASRLRDAVMDMCSFQVNGCVFLTALTEKALHVYELKN